MGVKMSKMSAQPPQPLSLFQHIPLSPWLIAADVSRIDLWCWAPNGARQLMALSVSPGVHWLKQLAVLYSLLEGRRMFAPASKDITATHLPF